MPFVVLRFLGLYAIAILYEIKRWNRRGVLLLCAKRPEDQEICCARSAVQKKKKTAECKSRNIEEKKRQKGKQEG
jgi:hypothetical protein